MRLTRSKRLIWTRCPSHPQPRNRKLAFLIAFVSRGKQTSHRAPRHLDQTCYSRTQTSVRFRHEQAATRARDPSQRCTPSRLRLMTSVSPPAPARLHSVGGTVHISLSSSRRPVIAAVFEVFEGFSKHMISLSKPFPGTGSDASFSVLCVPSHLNYISIVATT